VDSTNNNTNTRSEAETAPSTPSSLGSGTFTISVANDSSQLPERLSTQVAKGEVKLALAVIESGISYNAMDTLLPAIKAVDPNSKVWQSVSLGSRKLSYAISDAIGPYFHEKHLQSARRAEGFSLSLDSAHSSKRVRI
jgi:hypothetical protein